MCTWQACCHRLDKAWSSFFTEHTFFPRVPDQSVTWQEEWGRLSSQFGGRFLNSFLKGWAQFFMLLWLETLSTLFFVLQLCIILWCMLLSTPYSQNEIASLNGWMSLKLYKSWRILCLRKACMPCVWWTLSFLSCFAPHVSRVNDRGPSTRPLSCSRWKPIKALVDQVMRSEFDTETSIQEFSMFWIPYDHVQSCFFTFWFFPARNFLSFVRVVLLWSILRATAASESHV